MSDSHLETGATVEVPHLGVRDTVKVDFPQAAESAVDTGEQAADVLDVTGESMTEDEAKVRISRQLILISDFLMNAVELIGEGWETLPEQVPVYKNTLSTTVDSLGDGNAAPKELIMGLERRVLPILQSLQRDMKLVEKIEFDFNAARREIRKGMAVLADFI